ncbi:hypothetical protein [Streptomyces sp. NPDC018833]|uniref:hypothetical protein n=1 Tax=Streptomyces sp. NPDC018833 TaxID=3365053 RepID=UPI0037BDAFA2
MVAHSCATTVPRPLSTVNPAAAATKRVRPAEAVVARCRKDRLEPPASGQIARLVGKAVNTFEERFCAATVARLSAATRSRLDDLIAEDAGASKESAGGGGTFFTELKADPGVVRCRRP